MIKILHFLKTSTLNMLEKSRFIIWLYGLCYKTAFMFPVKAFYMDVNNVVRYAQDAILIIGIK